MEKLFMNVIWLKVLIKINFKPNYFRKVRPRIASVFFSFNHSKYKDTNLYSIRETASF